MTYLKTTFILLALASSSFSYAVSDNSQQVQAEKTPELIGLDCIGDYASLLPYLGRGTDFPDFLVEDVNSSLVQQSATSVLSKIECTSEVKIQTGVLPGESEDERVLSMLKLTFPLTVDVKNGNDTYQLKVEQHYKAENLETTDKRQASQVFEVKSQQVLP